MKRTTPFQCFHKQPVPEAAAAANRWQEHVQRGGAEGAWAPAPLAKVPFCQGNFFYLFFLNTLLWRPAQSNY